MRKRGQLAAELTVEITGLCSGLGCPTGEKNYGLTVNANGVNRLRLRRARNLQGQEKDCKFRGPKSYVTLQRETKFQNERVVIKYRAHST
jgi:hypothetical protein